MPELPEVETVRKGLSKRLMNFEIRDVEVCRERVIASPGGANLFISMMKGNCIGNWERRGKYLIASLYKKDIDSPKQSKLGIKNSGWWGVHLRMTGYFQWHPSGSKPCPHTRVRFWNKEGFELRFVDIRSFGQMWWVPPNQSPESIISGLSNLGPEPFSKEFNYLYIQKELKGKKKAIKSALLDQSLVAGTGNIYADESLYMAGILPTKPAGNLTTLEYKKLCSNLIKVLKISIGEGGTTFSDFRNLEGVNGNYGGQAWVYRRNNQPCRKCGTKIIREKLSGRSTHWCPNCQN